MTDHNYTREEFEHAARTFVEQLPFGKKATVIALHGDLGAGKTTFVQAVAEFFGVKEHVVSPTFVIQKQYSLEGQKFGTLVHIDAYRLSKSQELLVLGWEDLVRDPANIILVEWPENVPELFGPDTQHIYFTYVDENLRNITYGKND